MLLTLVDLHHLFRATTVRKNPIGALSVEKVAVHVLLCVFDTALEDKARHTGLLLAPGEGFSQAIFCPSSQKKIQKKSHKNPKKTFKKFRKT